MRLLFVGTDSGGGGAGTHFVTLATALAEAGDDIAAVVRPGSPVDNWLAGGPVHARPGIFRNVFDLRGARAVVEAVRRQRPDWIIGAFSKEYWPLVVLGRSLGVRVALFRHLSVPMKRGTVMLIPRLADRFIVVSKSMRAALVAQGVPAERLSMLPNPIDLRRFRPDAAARAGRREALGLAPDDVLVGYVGAFHMGKGTHLLADALDGAMAERGDLHSVWVGEGRAAQAVAERLAASPHSRRHHLLAWTPDPTTTYAALDILAVPSITIEGFGRVAVEAEASGVPVLASAIGGLPEAVQDGVTGRLLPPGDRAAWTTAILQLARDAETRNRYAAAGPAFAASHFDATVIAAKFRELLGMRNDASR
jgi:glycosyltransferase involved in cell wall biosynthesis